MTNVIEFKQPQKTEPMTMEITVEMSEDNIHSEIRADVRFNQLGLPTDHLPDTLRWLADWLDRKPPPMH